MLTLWLLLAGSVAAEPTARPVVHLADDGYLPGDVCDSDDPNLLRWRSPPFARPFEFPLGAVRGVHYPVPAVPPQPAGEYAFELIDDDVLTGDLLSLTDDEMELDTAPVGRLQLRRDRVRRFYRRQGADTVFVGPNGLAGWTDPSPAPRWRDEGGQLLTDRPGATLFADLGLPEKAAIEVEISWKTKPDFTLALGVDERDASAKHAFRMEVWDGELVAVGESATDADVATVQRPATGAGRVRVQMYLDQPERRLILLSPTGKTLATLAIAGNKSPSRTGVRLTNGKGDVRLEHLRVTRWNGRPPRDVRENESRVHRADGSVVYGRLAAFDPATKQFTVRDGEASTVVAHDALADVFLAPAADQTPAAPDLPTLRVVYLDGSRFSGTLSRIEDAHLTLACPGVKEPLRLPLAGVRSLVPLRTAGAAEIHTRPLTGRAGRLEVEGARLKGRLVGGEDAADAGRLVWQPDVSRNASPLLPGLSGRIVYRDPPPAPPPPPPSARVAPFAEAVAVRAGVAEAVIVGDRGGPSAPQAAGPRLPAGGRRAMHLRTGDTIPCEVRRIDEKGVHFKTPQSDATFVAHEKVKSVELIATKVAPALDEVKRDRLLTLPRMQRDSPPTHLICSKTGDFLRGRVVEMDDAVLKVEVRLEVREVPRDRVAQIIWLHADELKGPTDAAPADAAGATRVQAVGGDGHRLTFVVARSNDRMVEGTSEILGRCRSALSELDQLLFGAAIEESAAKLAYHEWKLRHAVEPKFVQADGAGSGDGPSGTESPLVGQPAPPFQLDRLDGGKYRLAERKGKVVVLDFWATWCGPCLSYMPLVDGVCREFADRGVELLAVNMEEPAANVKSMLERHKLTMPVALDRDGVAAAKYAVTSIPQTVVIDREGKVVRVFVGGGKATAEALRKALEELAPKKE